MAIELIPNPTNIPETVDSSYQRQNINMSLIKTGMDTSMIYYNGDNKIIIPSDSVIEYNGALYKNNSPIDLTDSVKNILLTNDNCYLSFDGTSIEATADKGELIPSKNARYTTDNKRLLNMLFRQSVSDEWNWIDYPGNRITATFYKDGIYYFADYTANARAIIYSTRDFKSFFNSITLDIYVFFDTITNILYGDNKFVFFANDSTSTPSPSYIATSTDGKNWTVNTGHSCTKAVYINNLFITVGSGIYTSPDGITWTQRSSTNYFYDIFYDNDLYVALGRYIYTSPDGITWTQRFSITSYIYNGIYANGLFVGVGSGIYTSPDGITWTQRDTYNLQKVIYANGLFVAVGGGGGNNIITSPDGITWTPRVNNSSIVLYSIIYNHNQFIAVGNFNILTSSDGINWAFQGAKNTLTYISLGNKLIVCGYALATKDLYLDIGKYVPEINSYNFSNFSYSGDN